MGFESKFKINFYREHFSEILKNTPVLSLLFFSVLVMHISMERLYTTKFAAGFYGV